MVGHCGGLRRSQQLGDYVLAHAYVRDDHVLDQTCRRGCRCRRSPRSVGAAGGGGTRDRLSGTEMKTRMRTGTVVSTDDRNWELKSKALYARFNQSRAIAIDMESATVAANGFRLRVPYGTLLCVSDKPLHGELKLRGMANAFYRQRVSQHMTIGLRRSASCARTASSSCIRASCAASTNRPSAEAAFVRTPHEGRHRTARRQGALPPRRVGRGAAGPAAFRSGSPHPC